MAQFLGGWRKSSGAVETGLFLSITCVQFAVVLDPSDNWIKSEISTDPLKSAKQLLSLKEACFQHETTLLARREMGNLICVASLDYAAGGSLGGIRSEERRVGKECRS